MRALPNVGEGKGRDPSVGEVESELFLDLRGDRHAVLRAVRSSSSSDEEYWKETTEALIMQISAQRFLGSCHSGKAYLLLVADECVKEELCDRAGVGTEGNPSSELSASGESYILLRSVKTLRGKKELST